MNIATPSLSTTQVESMPLGELTVKVPSSSMMFQSGKRKKKTNQLHEIRVKEKQMIEVQRKKLASKIDRGLERKRLSSAFTHARKEASNVNNVFNIKSPREFSTSAMSNNIATKEDEEEQEDDVLFGRKFHFVHIIDEDVTITKACSRASTATTSLREKPLSQTYFVPSLVELCASAIANNFEQRPTFEKIPSELQQLISKKLPVDLPLQLSVPLISDDDYWKKCCMMRWTLGQLGTYCRKNGNDLFIEEHPGHVDDVMIKGSFKSRVNARKKISKASRSITPSSMDRKPEKSKTWKQLYLEINLDEFFETLQPQKTVLQELKTIFLQPKPEEKTIQNSELSTLRTLHQIKQTLNEEKALKEELTNILQDQQKKKGKKQSPTDQENAVEQPEAASILNASHVTEHRPVSHIPKHKCLHSHLMRPNVNYYLLHCNTLSEEEREQYPIDKFKAKLKDLFDGIQSQGTSRLAKITKDDDIFTFYESAIQRKEQKFNTSNESKMQYWLLNKKEQLEETDEEVQQMFDFIRKKNQEHLMELCDLSKNFISEINIRGLKEHVDLQELFDALPNLETVRMEYTARNVGMTFDTLMLGMKKRDCQMLGKILSDPKKAVKLHSLILSENLIDDEQTKIITSGLYQNTRITFLDFSHNKISVEGCKSIAAMMKSNKCLKTLLLSDNEIQTDGALYIGSGLKFNITLTELNLSLNKISDSGAISIISNANHLSRLNLSNNVITDEGVMNLINKLEECNETKEHPCIPKVLDISGNFLSSQACNKLIDLSGACPFIENIDVRQNQDIKERISL
ncbi:hypothetical protein C9374_007362 [Naegleria lovaniensis]|uniref:Uncharacterized protein n=1 Tax=Naegleria lovaniensis TaxID=51637 RepID=A0AA88GMX6_NAELO|nr:uncharacterized protein C9374_007362 [Naegleria lovaniensis]KAG2379223.1 hypothetical protein C9374_007362 [Naegleria lovaniensis]